MGQTCDCNYASNIDESTFEESQTINHKIHNPLSITNAKLKFVLKDEDLHLLTSVLAIDKSPDIESLSLIQLEEEEDMYNPITPTTSVGHCKMYTINESGTKSQNRTTPPPLSLSGQHQLILSNDDMHKANGKDEEGLKPNLFRKDTKNKWNFVDIEDLENDISQELQFMHYNMIVDNQVSLYT